MMIKVCAWALAAVSALLVACQAAIGAGPLATGAARPSAPRELRIGDTGPDFVLSDQKGQEVRLSQFRGRPVQLAFYVWALSSG